MNPNLNTEMRELTAAEMEHISGGFYPERNPVSSLMEAVIHLVEAIVAPAAVINWEHPGS
jgi:hypothetical protein